MFRKLNPLEVEISRKLKARNRVPKGMVAAPDKLKVEYVQQGNTTLAIVQNPRKTLVGWSKYNPNDAKLGIPFNEEVGQRRAFVRALTGGEAN